MTLQEFNQTLENGPYAWPGGYPLFFITHGGAALSFKTVEANADKVRAVINGATDDAWDVVACDVNWEDADLTCDETGERIESAYADA